MSTTDTRAMRQEFVAYWRARYQYSPTHAFLDEFGNFCTPKDDPVYMGWEAWQAATEAAKATGTAGELPPLPEWTKMDNLGGFVPSEVRQEMRAYGKACAEAARIRNPKFSAEDIEAMIQCRAEEIVAARQPAPVVQHGDLDAVAEAIFKVMKDSNMTDKDWKNGSILGFENSFRDQIKEAATAALAVTNRSQPEKFTARAGEDIRHGQRCVLNHEGKLIEDRSQP